MTKWFCKICKTEVEFKKIEGTLPKGDCPQCKQATVIKPSIKSL
jgi:hypothetical protein